MSRLDSIPDFTSLFRQTSQNDSRPLGLFGPTDFFGLSKAGTAVTPKTALSLPAVYSAVRLISETIATLPFQVFEDTGTTKKLRKDHPIYPLIHDKPNTVMTSYIWRQQMAIDVMLWGNHISLISERKSTIPTQLTRFSKDNVVAITLMDGKLWYTLRTTDGDITVDQSNVVHVKGMGDGLVGKSVISFARENLGLGIAQQNTASNFYGKGMQLDYAITMASGLSPEGLDNLRKTIKKYTATDGERVFLPLDAGMDVKLLGIPPQDAQFLESRKFSVTDVSRWFRVPPPLIYDLEKATFSNITELVLSFVKFSLTPWLVNIETELNDKLFKESEKGIIFSEFNVDGLLRGDAKQRAESNKTALQNGYKSINEVRASENLNPISGGDKHLVPLNFTTIESVGNDTSSGTVENGLRKLLTEKNGEVPTEIRTELEQLLNN